MAFQLEIYLLVIAVVVLHLIVLAYVTRKPRKSIKGRHVLVTGGSSGIGLHIAIGCVKLGANVTIVARNSALLEKAATLIRQSCINDSQRVTYKSLDLSKSYQKVSRGLADIEKENGDIFMLVNCAGTAICGVLEDVSVEDALMLMNLNYFGTYFATRYVLPRMKSSKEGIIVITASQAALLGIYGYGAYTASKFALRGLAETIATETKHLGISVTLALPTDTATPGFENEQKSKPEETKQISGSGGLADPSTVANKILCDALSGSFFSILGFESWILTTLCVGMAPWGGFYTTMLQALVLGPLRLLGVVLQWNFTRIIKNCAKDKQA